MSKPQSGQQSRRDRIIEAIFDSLPATTQDEINRRVRRKVPEANDVNIVRALGHLRRNTEKYGWTVPHVGGDHKKKNRYFALLVERDGTYHFDESPESRGHFRDGSKSMVTRIASESGNQAMMLRVAATHERSRAKRAEFLNLSMDCDYVARKALALAQAMDGDDNGGAGGRKAA